MNDNKIIDGKLISNQIREKIKFFGNKLISKTGKKPGLAVVLVGENPASQIYIRNKTKKFDSLGLKSEIYRLEEGVSEEELLTLIDQINNDDTFHGILVQLPLPDHIDSQKVIHAISPTKDVDGFHPENAGLLSIGTPRFVPCTPKGIMYILKHFNVELDGKYEGDYSSSHYYSGSSNSGKNFAYAYYRDELINEELNPDINIEQEDNQNNPHWTKHTDANNKFVKSLEENFNDQFRCDVIGTSYCRSRAIACTKEEFQRMKMNQNTVMHLKIL